eukprot:Skav209685  [mRNA]  locus=scaffold5822:21086:21892:- [translate_table: standard]
MRTRPYFKLVKIQAVPQKANVAATQATSLFSGEHLLRGASATRPSYGHRGDSPTRELYQKLCSVTDSDLNGNKIGDDGAKCLAPSSPMLLPDTLTAVMEVFAFRDSGRILKEAIEEKQKMDSSGYIALACED